MNHLTYVLAGVDIAIAAAIWATLNSRYFLRASKSHYLPIGLMGIAHGLQGLDDLVLRTGQPFLLLDRVAIAWLMIYFFFAWRRKNT